MFSIYCLIPQMLNLSRQSGLYQAEARGRGLVDGRDPSILLSRLPVRVHISRKLDIEEELN